MPITRKLLIAILCLAMVDGASSEEISFEREIAPILVTHCYECHGPDAEQREAGLRLDDRAAATSELDSGVIAIVPGKPEHSELLLRVASCGDDRMPPEDSGEGLTDHQIASLRAWIEAGAEYQRHWAFSPLKTNNLPRDVSAWAENPIDVFVESRLRRANLVPADEADCYTLIRRLYFDLCGLPPTPEQIRRFVDDRRPNAYAALVDALLSSPAYGERWGRHWLDVARYGDSNGGDENHAYPLAHYYRDYVIQAFNEDLPYDRFVTQQLAGDLLPITDDKGLNSQRLTATGYLAIGMKILAEQDPVKKQADMVDEQIDTFGRTFLGLSLGCARCHDHKFDPIPTRDYYALAGIFHSSNVGDQPIKTRDYERSLRQHQKQVDELKRQIDSIHQQLESICGTNAAILREAESFDRGNVIVDNDNYGNGIGIISDPGAQKNFAEFDIQIPEAADYVLQLRYAAASARPGQLEINGQLVKESSISQETGGWNPDAQAWITEGVFPLRAGTNVVRLQSEPMMSHIDKLRLVRRDRIELGTLDQLDTLTERLTALSAQAPEPKMVMAVVDGETHSSRLHVRGSHLQLGQEIPRGFLSILDGQQNSIPGNDSGRLQLAEWLTQNKTASTVTARVIANRVWRWHFGRGLVATPDDFGIRGEPPTHPDLLDFLATELIDHDWSIKRLSRLIVTSRTYRMASSCTEDDALSRAMQIDPENQLLWKRSRVRIDAESIRDALLLQAGELEWSLGNAPMRVKSQDPSPQDMATNLKMYEEARRRSVYLPIVRSNVYEFLTLFDFPNAASPVGKRDTTTIPTQALWMMNSPFITKQARNIAKRVERYDAHDAIESLYLRLFAREPTEREIVKGVAFVERMAPSAGEQQAWIAYCQVLLASNEYLYLK